MITRCNVCFTPCYAFLTGQHRGALVLTNALLKRSNSILQPCMKEALKDLDLIDIRVRFL